jgi:hypothetical protein
MRGVIGGWNWSEDGRVGGGDVVLSSAEGGDLCEVALGEDVRLECGDCIIMRCCFVVLIVAYLNIKRR